LRLLIRFRNKELNHLNKFIFITKTIQLQTAILDFFNEYVSERNSEKDQVKYKVVADKENRIYQVIFLGWENRKFHHGCVFHFDIINDKIWIQVNNTDILVNEDLEKRGVKKEEMVIGFLPEYMRPHTGFATA